MITEYLQNRFNPTPVFIQISTANLHLHYRVTPLKIPPDLLYQRRDTSIGIVAACCVNEYPGIGYPIAEPLCEQCEKRLLFDLGNDVPYRHIDGAHSNTTLAVPAGLLVRHHCIPDLKRVKVLACIIQELLGRRPQNPGDKPLPE